MVRLRLQLVCKSLAKGVNCSVLGCDAIALLASLLISSTTSQPALSAPMASAASGHSICVCLADPTKMLEKLTLSAMHVGHLSSPLELLCIAGAFGRLHLEARTHVSMCS